VIEKLTFSIHQWLRNSFFLPPQYNHERLEIDHDQPLSLYPSQLNRFLFANEQVVKKVRLFAKILC